MHIRTMQNPSPRVPHATGTLNRRMTARDSNNNFRSCQSKNGLPGWHEEQPFAAVWARSLSYSLLAYWRFQISAALSQQESNLFCPHAKVLTTWWLQLTTATEWYSALLLISHWSIRHGPPCKLKHELSIHKYTRFQARSYINRQLLYTQFFPTNRRFVNIITIMETISTIKNPWT